MAISRKIKKIVRILQNAIGDMESVWLDEINTLSEKHTPEDRKLLKKISRDLRGSIDKGYEAIFVLDPCDEVE